MHVLVPRFFEPEAEPEQPGHLYVGAETRPSRPGARTGPPDVYSAASLGAGSDKRGYKAKILGAAKVPSRRVRLGSPLRRPASKSIAAENPPVGPIRIDRNKVPGSPWPDASAADCAARRINAGGERN